MNAGCGLRHPTTLTCPRESAGKIAIKITQKHRLGEERRCSSLFTNFSSLILLLFLLFFFFNITSSHIATQLFIFLC